ncbi:MAG: hypothetical protein ACP5UT_03060 [Bryobacteraceae bacterium]
MRFTSTALTAALMCLSAAGGQATSSTGFNRPPAGVDEALRARIEQFYGLEQQGKFRQAEALVCEESRDRYYDMEKRRWTSIQLLSIVYEENFTRARASVALGTTMSTLSGPIPVTAPLSSLWRQEGGEWCRYIPDPAKDGVATPFGTMRSAPAAGNSAASSLLPAPVRMPASAEELHAMVRLSRESVTLPLSGGTEEVEIHNAMPGTVELRLVAPTVKGLEASLSSPSIPAGGKSTLKLSWSPPEGAAPPPQCTVRVVAEPIGAEKYVRIEFRR